MSFPVLTKRDVVLWTRGVTNGLHNHLISALIKIKTLRRSSRSRDASPSKRDPRLPKSDLRSKKAPNPAQTYFSRKPRKMLSKGYNFFGIWAEGLTHWSDQLSTGSTIAK